MGSRVLAPENVLGGQESNMFYNITRVTARGVRELVDLKSCFFRQLMFSFSMAGLCQK